MSNNLLNLPSLIIASILGVLAILLVLVGICKVYALISAPTTPDLLQSARLNLSKIQSTQRGQRRRQRSARRTKEISPPRLSGSGQAPVEHDLSAPIHRPVACRNSSAQTEQFEQSIGKAEGRPILGRHKSFELTLRDNWAQVSSSDADLQAVKSEGPVSPRDKLFSTSFH
jgi:hypothetical protein